MSHTCLPDLPIRPYARPVRLCALLTLLALLPGAQAASPTPAPANSVQAASAVSGRAIGQVSFLAGEARLERAGSPQPVQTGSALEEGDTLITAANGHIHLRMVDGGFIAVRPGSRLQLTRYRFDPDQAANNRVLLQLESGTARTISGQAGEANRARYRFTTPVAAIGLRGTDYVVDAAPDLTRVHVLKGAIVMNPLGSGCTADLDTPCLTPYMRELAAGNPDAWLELRRVGQTPQIRRYDATETDPAAPRAPGSPPHPREPQAKTEMDVLQAAQGQNTVLPSQPNANARIVWGRWESVATPGPTLVSQLQPGREVGYGHALFGLLQPTTLPSLPQSGTLSLSLDAAEAWRQGADGALSPVAISQGRLDLDFNRRQFATRLDAQLAEGLTPLSAQGAISFQGYLNSDPAHSNMNVAGVLAGQEAGYLFDSAVPGGHLYGATHWKR